MSAQTFRFDFNGDRSFAIGHTSRDGGGIVMVGVSVTTNHQTTLRMDPKSARAMAIALEAAATFAENALPTGLGESIITDSDAAEGRARIEEAMTGRGS